MAHASPLKVLLSSAAVRPGDTLRVELEGILHDRHARVVFSGGSYPFYAIGPDAQRALIGIRLETAPGRYPLRVDTLAKTQPPQWQSSIERNVEIATRAFPVEEVAFSAEKTRLLPWEQAEGARIHKLLRMLTRTQYWEGDFDRPVPGPLEGVFGARRVRNGHGDAGFHKGEDLKAGLGAPVLASNSGIVLMAAALKAHGRTVLLNHGQGVMTIYLHMNSIAVRPGQKVVKGRRLGTVGSSGLSTSPHVHWGLYVHGVAVDPQPWTETEF